MLEVNLTLVSETEGSTANKLLARSGNGNARQFSALLKEKNYLCKLHPNHTSTITVQARTSNHGLPKVIKENFCCTEFEKAIQFDEVYH